MDQVRYELKVKGDNVDLFYYVEMNRLASNDTHRRALDEFEILLTKDNRIKIDRKAFDVV